MNIYEPVAGIDSRNALRAAKYFDDYEKTHPKTSSVESDNQQLNSKMVKIKEKTDYVDEKGCLLSNAEINDKIIQKIGKIYSVDSVTVNKTMFEFGGSLEKRKARKIEIKRTWCFYDLVPLGVFLPTLLNKESVYHKPINTNRIQDFVLGARPKKNEIKIIMHELAKTFQNYSIDERSQMNAIIESKYNSDDNTYEITDADRVGKSREFLEKFGSYIQKFKSEYESITYEGRNHLIIAFWKSKSLTIYIPEEVQDDNLEAYIEVPKDSGITPLAIKMAISLRHLCGY